MAWVWVEGSPRFIDRKGTVIYEMATVIYPNTEKVGYINTAGKITIMPFAEGERSFYLEETSFITQESAETAGYYDKNGNCIYEIAKETIDGKNKDYIGSGLPRTDGLICLVITERRNYTMVRDAIIFVDRLLKRPIVIIESYNKDKIVMDDSQSTWGFSNSRAFIKTKYSDWGVINMREEYIIKPQNDWIPVTMFKNGLASVKFGDDLAFVNREGKIVYKE